MNEKFAVFGAISSAFDGAKSKFWSLLGWLILPVIALIAVFILLGLAFSGLFAGLIALMSNPYALQGAYGYGAAGLGGGVIVGLLVFYGLIFLWASFYNIYSCRLGTQAILGEELRAGEARGRGFSRMISLLLINIVILIGIVAVVLIAALVIGGLAVLGGIGAVLAIILGLALFVAYIYVALGLSGIVGIVANEGAGFSAISRSWQLVNGNRWQLLGHGLMWLLIFIGIGIAVGILGTIAGLFGMVHIALAVILIALIYFALLAFMTVLGATQAGSLYLELLKANGEKLDSTL